MKKKYEKEALSQYFQVSHRTLERWKKELRGKFVLPLSIDDSAEMGGWLANFYIPEGVCRQDIEWGEKMKSLIEYIQN